MQLIGHLLAHQDPDAPHTLLTRCVISGIILFASLVYAGFFGVMGAVATYLVGVELMGGELRWALAPLLIAGVLGLRSGIKQLVVYWRDHGHG